MGDQLQHKNKTFISTSLAAELTGYSQDYVGRLARDGYVASTKAGRQRFIDRDALIAYARENKNGFQINHLPQEHCPGAVADQDQAVAKKSETPKGESKKTKVDTKAKSTPQLFKSLFSDEAVAAVKEKSDRPTARWRKTRDGLQAAGDKLPTKSISRLPAIAMAFMLAVILGIGGLGMANMSITDSDQQLASVEEAHNEKVERETLTTALEEARYSASMAAAAVSSIGDFLSRPIKNFFVDTLFYGVAGLLQLGDVFVADGELYTAPSITQNESRERPATPATQPTPGSAGSLTYITTTNNNTNTRSFTGSSAIVDSVTRLASMVTTLANRMDSEPTNEVSAAVRDYVEDQIDDVADLARANVEANLYTLPRNINLEGIEIENLTKTNRLSVTATTSIDGSTFFVDATNNRVGIGTSTPRYALDVFGDFGVTGTTTFSGPANFATTTIDNLIVTNASTTNATTTNSYIRELLVDNSTTTNAYITDLLGDDATLTNLEGTNATITNATTTNFFASLANFTQAFFDTLTATVATITNFTADNATTTNLVATEANTTNLTASGTTNLQTTSIANLDVSGTATTSNLVVTDDATFGDTVTDSFSVNSTIGSNLVPNSNATYNLGSPSFYWDVAYIDTINANNLSAASSSISGTAAEDFTINSDNSSVDGERASIIFYRGQVTPNAVFSWDNVADRFDFNQPALFWNEAASTTIPTLTVQGTAGQTADLFQAASSTGAVLVSVTADGTIEAPNVLTTDLTATNLTSTGVIDLATSTIDAITTGGDTINDFTGVGLSVAANVLSVSLAPFSTTDLTEGTNLYFTDQRARDVFSTTATGLNYTAGTGVLSLSSGYVIPTTVSTGQWDTAYAERGSQIAGTGLTWSGSVLEVSNVESLGTSLTAGSIVFSDGNNFAEDNSNFFWDDANNRLGIGTNGPSATLFVGASGSTPRFRVESATSSLYAFEIDGDDQATVGTGYGNIFLDTSGDTRVGIGTSTVPTGLVYINQGSLGDGLGINADSSGNASLKLYQDNVERFWLGNSATNNTFLQNTGSGNITLRAGTTGSGDLIFESGNSNEVARITSAGLFGVGVASPAQELDVAGTIRQSAVVSCTSIETDADGDIVCGASDENLKTNVQTLDQATALQQINELRGVTFDWKNTEQFGHVAGLGFIAQDVEKIFPDLVRNSGSYKSLDYSKLTAVLTEALQEVDRKVEELSLANQMLSEEFEQLNDTDSSTKSSDDSGYWLDEDSIVQRVYDKVMKEIVDDIVAELTGFINSTSEKVAGFFNSLFTERIIITREEGAENQSVGEGEISAGEDRKKIENELVDANSRVLVTFTSTLAGRSFHIEKKEGSFTVVLSEKLEDEADRLAFDYLIIGVATVEETNSAQEEVAGTQDSTATADDGGGDDGGMDSIDPRDSGDPVEESKDSHEAGDESATTTATTTDPAPTSSDSEPDSGEGASTETTTATSSDTDIVATSSDTIDSSGTEDTESASTSSDPAPTSSDSESDSGEGASSDDSTSSGEDDGGAGTSNDTDTDSATESTSTDSSTTTTSE